MKHFFDWTIIGGATIIPRSPGTTRNEKNFQDRPKKIKNKSYMTLKYLIIIDFPKFEPLTAAEMALWKSWAKMSTFIPLSLRLSGIEFSLV